MERRFAARAMEGIRFVEGIDGGDVGSVGTSEDRAKRGCFASHLKALRLALEDPSAETDGLVILEDDALVHEDFNARLGASLGNLPSGAPTCLLGYMLSPPEAEHVWAGRDPRLHNLVRAQPNGMWGSHAYWMSADRARSVLKEWEPVPFDDLPEGNTERFTVTEDGYAAWPSLALQEATDSTLRPISQLREIHIDGQSRWPIADYLAPEDDAGPFANNAAEPPTVALCMIVRDEAEVLERCIESVRGLIDSWTICDTGSTDGTPELVERLLSDVPGQLHRTDWVDFGHNRSELMRLARGTADYLLLIDADMTIIESGPLPMLVWDAYALRHEGSLGYWIPRLVRGDSAWYFQGSTHEYLACESEHTQARLYALRVEHFADGGTRAEKYERDRTLLEAELDRDPGQERATFYLAQTLRDMGDTERAIELYERRAELGGWDEEVFYAAFQAASLRAESDPETAIPHLLAAFERRPTRVEPLFRLMQAFGELGWHESAYSIGLRAIEITEPADSLFVARDTYAWRVRFEHAMNAHRTERDAEARDEYEALLVNPDVPGGVKNSAYENLRRLRNRANPGVAIRQEGVPRLSDLAPSVSLGEIKLAIEPAWPQFNPSIANDGDGFRLIVRSSNYSLREGVYSMLDESGEIRTLNYLAHLSPELEVIDVEPLRGEDDLERHPFPVVGWEDCRIFQVNDGWYATAVARDLDPEGVCRTVLLSLDGARVTEARILPGPDPHRHEKNWMPFTDDGELRFVYSSSPTVVTSVDPAGGGPVTVAVHDAPAQAKEFRGGSNGVKTVGGTLFCIHEAFDFDGPRRYLHRFVHFDPDWKLEGVTPRFHLTGNDVEMCTGLARRGEELVFTFGVGDRAAALGVCLEQEILDLVEPVARVLSDD